MSPGGQRVDTFQAHALWLAKSEDYNALINEVDQEMRALRAHRDVVLGRLAKCQAIRDRLVAGAEECKEAAVWYLLRGQPHPSIEGPAVADTTAPVEVPTSHHDIPEEWAS